MCPTCLGLIELHKLFKRQRTVKEAASCVSEILAPSQGTELWLFRHPCPQEGPVTLPGLPHWGLSYHPHSPFPWCPWWMIFRVTKPLAGETVASLSDCVPKWLCKTEFLPCPLSQKLDQWVNHLTEWLRFHGNYFKSSYCPNSHKNPGGFEQVSQGNGLPGKADTGFVSGWGRLLSVSMKHTDLLVSTNRKGCRPHGHQGITNDGVLVTEIPLMLLLFTG